MFKIVKTYLKNFKDLPYQEIYCIRVNFNEDLELLKNKVFLRCPQLRNEEPEIYWLDLENDRIKITCDDDLKFFLEESPCKKLVFDFNPASEVELSRKRSCSNLDDEANESSKKIRRQLQQIDLSSDSSLMDTDDDDDLGGEASTSMDTSNNSSVNVLQQSLDEMIPSTSAAALKSNEKSPNVNIISVDIINPSNREQTESESTKAANVAEDNKKHDEQETIEIPDENGNEVHVIDEEPDTASVIEEKTREPEESLEIEKALPEKNRIVISDSSDEDDVQDNTNNNRRHSDGPSSSAYSFTNVNGNCFESRSSFRGGRHHHEHRFSRNNSHHEDRDEHHRGHGRGHGHHHHRGRNSFPGSFHDHLPREFQRIHAENMRQVHRNVQAARDSAIRAREVAVENAARARDFASRAARLSTSAIPDMMSNFRAHFQPLFSVSDINQHVFTNLGRR